MNKSKQELQSTTALFAHIISYFQFLFVCLCLFALSSIVKTIVVFVIVLHVVILLKINKRNHQIPI